MLTEINNYRFYKFISLPETEQLAYMDILKHLCPNDFYRWKTAKQIPSLPYFQVQNIREAMMRGTFEDMAYIFKIVFNIKRKTLARMRIVHFFGLFNFVLRELEKISNIERVLASESEPELVQAGISELERFGQLNPLDAIGKAYSRHPKEVETWAWDYCFSLLYKQKVEADIQKKYTEIMNNKHK